MRVLIAMDKFKGALGAQEACEVVAGVLRRERPGWQLDQAPLSDGGEGFCPLLTRAAAGTWSSVVACGPLFDEAGACERKAVEIGWVDLQRVPPAARARLGLEMGLRRLAILEMAAVNGLSLVLPERRDVWRSSSYGTGELIGAAADAGADAVLLGVGGSATSDLGFGALCALGLRCEDAHGVELAPVLPASFAQVAQLRGAVRPLPPLRIACDVDNPLLGPTGAAQVYGPQKGLAPERLPRFEREASRLARLLCEHAGQDPGLSNRPGAGAAGGIGFGLLAAAGAEIVPGFQLVADWLALPERIAQADLVIGGEGCFDATSRAGKGPGALAQLALGRQRRCVLFAGAVLPAERETALAGVEVVAVSPPDVPLERALRETSVHLSRAVQRWLDPARE